MSMPNLHHDLPPVFAHEDCKALYSFLTASSGQPVCLGAGATTRLGGLPAQMIAAARAIWERAGIAFDIVDPSDAFLADLNSLGLREQVLPQGDPA